MLRSAAGGIQRVHQALKAGRAIRLCWTEKIPSSSTSIPRAVQNGRRGSPSRVRGANGRLATKPME
ncbi:hypothetical protein D3C81_1655160 [compost metagenome]